MKRNLVISCLPLLLLLLIPFHIPLSVIYHTLEGYGTINRYIGLFAPAATAVLLFDTFRRHGKLAPLRLLWWLLLVVSVVIRLLLFPFQSADYEGALSMWFDTIREYGGFGALKERGFSDYNSIYLYLMAAITYLPIEKLYSIKALSAVFDYLAAFVVYRMLRKQFPHGYRPWLGFFALLFAPTVVFNSSLWAQCDMMYASCLLLALLHISRNGLKALAFFALALMFKLQAVFFALPLLALYARNRLKLVDFIWVPLAVWVLSVLPHFLLGRDLPDLMLIYARQIVRYPELSLNAPSVYQLLPGAPFALFNTLGIVLAITACMVFLLLALKYPPPSTQTGWVLMALVSAVLLPFVLPKMHERYFFLADVLAIVYACYRPKSWYIAASIVLISFFSYLPFLFEETVVPFPVLSLCMGLVLGALLRELYREWHPRLKPPFPDRQENTQ